MFDANMKFLPKDKLFFAQIWAVHDEGELASRGYKTKDILLCRKIDAMPKPRDIELEKEIRVEVFPERGEPFILKNWDGRDHYDWLVYFGCPDGTGFLSTTDKASGMSVLSRHSNLPESLRGGT